MHHYLRVVNESGEPLVNLVPEGVSFPTEEVGVVFPGISEEVIYLPTEGKFWSI
jgi:hypothetical protein